MKMLVFLLGLAVAMPVDAQQGLEDLDEATRQQALDLNRQALDQPHEMCTCWSPVDDVIAFQFRDETGNYDIYTVKADGSDVRRITAAPTKQGNVVWSSDGSELIYHSGMPRTPEWDIHAVSGDGSGLRAITSAPGRETHPTVSSTSGILAYQGLTEGRNSEVFLLDTDEGSPENITQRDGFDGMPHWFPDGNRLLYSRREARNELMVFDVASDTHSNLTSTEDVDEYGHGISADGRVVYYWARYAPDGAAFRQDIFSIDVASGDVTQWTNDADVQRCPTPSPDGSRIAFGVDDKDVAIMNLETKTVEYLGIPAKVKRLKK